ncbi:MAG: hypothetical protein KAG66_15405 [Methylococcales bacterium]|nr:hypothetical protein [Methylococcales bacterium]
MNLLKVREPSARHGGGNPEPSRLRKVQRLDGQHLRADLAYGEGIVQTTNGTTPVAKAIVVRSERSQVRILPGTPHCFP